MRPLACPARKGEDDQVFGVIVGAVFPARVKAIPLGEVDLFDRRVDRARGAAAQHHQHGDNDKR